MQNYKMNEKYMQAKQRAYQHPLEEAYCFTSNQT